MILELTESTCATEELLGVLYELMGLGIDIAIDDFGSGYSSLSLVKRLPARILKIDQALTRGVADDSRDRAIVRCLMEMSRSLGMNVLAEGVETQGQVRTLLELGCGSMQGYLLGKPVPEANFEVEVSGPTAPWRKVLEDL